MIIFCIVDADVLTSFAKSVASVLSTTLLSDYQEHSSNQTLHGLLKNVQKPQSSLDPGHNLSEGSEIPSNAYFGRYSRYTRESVPSKERKGAYLDALISDPAQYTKQYQPQAYPPYQFTANSDAQISYNQINNAEPPVNINNNDVRPNSIDTDIKVATLQYNNQYHDPSGFRYKPEPRHHLPNPKHYPQFAPQPTYQRLPQSSETEGINPNEDTDDNTETARITRRPYNLNYHGPFHTPYHPSFSRHPGIYPHDRPLEGGDQPVAPGSGQDESNPSRIIDDQNQGQSTLGNYEYGPGFHYRPPYHDGFYPGFPGYYPGPFNGNFTPGNAEQGGGNGTGGPYPFGRPFFEGPKFGPYGPYNQPFDPYFNGHGKPTGAHNPPENQRNVEQTGTPENGQGDVNGTGNRPPYGFPPYGPYYGGYNFPGYPPPPFHGFPNGAGYGFHDHLFPRIKTIPYLNFYPKYYHNFPLAPFPPFGGYYPYNNNKHMNEKPGTPEKPVENADAAAPTNGDVEMLSESKTEAIRSTLLNGYQKQYSPEYIAKESGKIMLL